MRSFSTLFAPTAVYLLTTQLVAAQNGDGGAASGNIGGSNGGTNNGAQGPSQSSANLSVGAIVAIAVVVGVVVILGVSTAYLFLQAKRRQWTIREQLRHSRKRVTTGLKAIAAPLTPGRGMFTPVKTRFTNSETAGLRGSTFASHKSRNFSRKGKTPIEEDTYALRGRDLEKGEAHVSTKSAGSGSHEADAGRFARPHAEKTGRAKQTMRIDIPQRAAAEAPQTPVWNKFLGRE